MLHAQELKSALWEAANTLRGAVKGTLLASGQVRPLDSSDDQTLPFSLFQNLA